MYSRLILAKTPSKTSHCLAKPAYFAAVCGTSQTRFSLIARHESLHLTRRSSSASAQATAPPPPAKKLAYPERLIIYHPGTARTTFLACLKLTTVFTFAFVAAVATPSYIAASQPAWATAGVFLCGLTPLLTIAYLTGPFATAVHCFPPRFARESRAALARWARSAAPHAVRLDVTTLSAIGKPRVTGTTLAALRPARERLGVVNFAREDGEVARENEARPWWRFRAVGKFCVNPGMEGNVGGGWVWREMEARIGKGSGGKGM